MIKNGIVIFFTVLFMAINSMPSIIIAIDDSVDISNFYGFSENEEENKENESEKFLEIVFFIENSNKSDDFLASNNIDHTEYRFKNYSKPYLNLISPPPEQYIF